MQNLGGQSIRYLGVQGDLDMLVVCAIRDVAEHKKLARELLEASHAKSRLLAAASHDLRQPIHTVNLLNSAASRAGTEEARQSIIEKQQRSLDTMGRLLNSSLDISKLGASVVPAPGSFRAHRRFGHRNLNLNGRPGHYFRRIPSGGLQHESARRFGPGPCHRSPRCGQSGLDVIQVLRQNTRGKLPFIIVSGDTSDCIRFNYLYDVSLMAKPVNTEKMLAEIR
jgi:hypothetical protein